jgi:hypothetical protein
MFCFEYVLFCVFCVLYSIVFYCIVLCIVVRLPSGTFPLAVNNNNNKLKQRMKALIFLLHRTEETPLPTKRKYYAND